METSELTKLTALMELRQFEEILEGIQFDGQPPVSLEPLWMEDYIYGYRVKETSTHYIDILRMIFNWRIVETVKANPMLIDRGWCYQGTHLAGFLPAALAAIAWDGSGDTEPPGYFKRVGA